jgi:hypothetical protein
MLPQTGKSVLFFGEVLLHSFFQGMCEKLAWTVKGQSFFLLYIIMELLGLYCFPCQPVHAVIFVAKMLVLLSRL